MHELFDTLCLNTRCDQLIRKLVQRFFARRGKREMIQAKAELAEPIARRGLARWEQEDQDIADSEVKAPVWIILDVADVEAEQIAIKRPRPSCVEDRQNNVVETGRVHVVPFL
jgi:hypothetical protein